MSNHTTALVVSAESSSAALSVFADDHPVMLWLRNHATRDKTVEQYTRTLREFLRWLHDVRGKDDLRRADLADMLAYREALSDPDRQPQPLKTASVVAQMRALSSLYTFLAHVGVDDGGVARNPITLLRLPEITDARAKRAWKLDELGAFFAAINATRLSSTSASSHVRGQPDALVRLQVARDTALFWLLFRNGLRVSEAIGARIGDYDEQSGARVVRIREHSRSDQHVKRGKARLAVLKPETAEALDTYLRLRLAFPGGDNERAEVKTGAVSWRELPLFAATKNGSASSAQRGLSRQQVYALMRRYGMAAGLDTELLHPHAARLTAITTLVRAGVDNASLMAFSGHASLQSVQAYVDLTQSVQENAAWRMPY